MTNHDHAGVGRARWAAVGAAVAVTLGLGGIGLVRATSPDGASAYVPINPCRIADTRPTSTVGDRATPLGADETWILEGWGEQGACADEQALPANITGLQLNVTAVDATHATYLQLFPGDGERGTASNLNPEPGQPPVPNAVTVALGADGTFGVFNRFGSVHVIMDVVGYFTDHDHDDRYYTKDEVYSRDEVYRSDEVDAQLDELESSVGAALESHPATRSGTLAYAWVCQPSAPLNTVFPLSECGADYSWNPAGPSTVNHANVGEYYVRFQGLEAIGHAQVSPYGESAICRAKAWFEDTVVVECSDLNGNPADATFNVLVID